MHMNDRPAVVPYRSSIVALSTLLLAAFAGNSFAQPDPALLPQAAAKTPSSAQMKAVADDMQKRVALIDQLASRFQSEAAAQGTGTFDAIHWKLDFGARLMHQSAAKLSQALTAPTLAMAQNELFNASVRVTEKHASDSDQMLNMITPCRIVDTRSGGGGQLGPVYRYWYASAVAATIAAQGGNASGCGQYPNANAFLLYVTVVPSPSATSPNFLTVQHNNTPTPPSSSTMNYVNHNIANFAIPACNPCLGGTGGFYAYASSNTHVVIDMIGYLQSEPAAALDCVTLAGTNNPLAAGTGGVAQGPTCTAGYTLVSGACVGGAAGVYNVTNILFAGGAYCYHVNTTGGASYNRGESTCCRTP
jgi:hypothetical protein